MLALTFTACGSTAGDDGGGDGWSYKSGDGKTYSADETPKRIIAQGEAAAALMSFGIKPKGIFLNDKLVVPRGRHHAERMTLTRQG